MVFNEIITEKLHLRPTVERPVGAWVDLLEQFDDSGRIARRKRRTSDDWEMPCSSKQAARFMSHAGTRMVQLDELEKVNGLDQEDEDALKETFPKHYSTNDVDSIMKKFRSTTVDQNSDDVKRNETKQWGNFEDDTNDVSLVRSTKIDDEDIQFDNGIGEEDDSDNPDSDIDEYSSDLLKGEFMSIMERRFLNGEDSEFFDYSKTEVDDKIREQDLEDAYFDKDD